MTEGAGETAGGIAGTEMALSVVIATHNRAAFLERCLDALAPQVRRPDVEVIVVDSCSDPDVAIRVRTAAERHGFTILRLDEPGVSKARNLGVALASAPWFATIDDDAEPARGWVEGALLAIAKAAPEAGVIQGRVEPMWIGTNPVKVEPRHARFLSLVMYDKDHEYGTRAICAGANMLVHRGLHTQIGGYGEAFGRVRDALISGIDTDLVDRMRGIGARIFYSNAFSVRHAVHAERLTRAWVRERSLHDGRAGGKIVFERRPFPVQAATVIKSLAALALFSALSLVSKPSFDLLIRRSVNHGILERAPVIGGHVRRFTLRHAERATNAVLLGGAAGRRIGD